MDGLDLKKEMDELLNSLDKAYSFMWTTGKQWAVAEHHYKIANKIEIFRLKQEDKVAWTACQALAQGSDGVADLRLMRDLSKIEYEVAKEKMLGLKMKARILEGEINRMWGAAK